MCYIYIYIIFYSFHLIIRLEYNFHIIIHITQLILFISWNYIHINTLYSLTNTHNLSLTHTLSHKLTHYSLMSWNCLILCKTHFLNVNIVIESTFYQKSNSLKKNSPNIFLHGQNNKYDFKKVRYFIDPITWMKINYFCSIIFGIIILLTELTNESQF